MHKGQGLRVPQDIFARRQSRWYTDGVYYLHLRHIGAVRLDVPRQGAHPAS
jgi:hypothetical protein